MKKSPTVISEWLSGDRNFTVDTLVEIEDALGIRLLDVSVMTAITAGTEISQKISVNLANAATIRSGRTWTIRKMNKEPDYIVNCA